MHGEFYKLVESMESIIEHYPLDELRALGLELKRHSEKKGLNPIEEIGLRRVGGMILEAQRVRQKYLKFVDCYMFGYDAYPSGANTMEELNYRIKTLMAIEQGAFESKKKGSRTKRGLKDSQSPTPHVDYMTKKNPSSLGKDEFKFLAKAGYVIATDCSGSLNPDSPLSGRLPLEGDCLDEETTFIFPGVQTGSCGDGTGSRVFLS